MQNISHLSLEINTDDISKEENIKDKNKSNKICKTEINNYKQNIIMNMNIGEKKKILFRKIHRKNLE